MPGNTFGHLFRITTWGESHGSGLGVVVDGVPAGLVIDVAVIQKELNRRRPGQSQVSTPRSESDRVEILSGIFNGMATGTPISMVVWNRDARSGAYENIKDLPRPGHADYPYMAKYGVRDHRGGGRSSARETIGRVAAGAIAKELLARYGINIVAHVVELGGVTAENTDNMDIELIREKIENNPVRCADAVAAEKMLATVREARLEGDSIGGVVEIIAKGVPAGVGKPVFDKLDAEIARAIMSIGAVKAVEFGAGSAAASMKGSQMNDPIVIKSGKICTMSNNAGGILGGLSTGMPIVCRATVKPTPSISLPQSTVNMRTNTEQQIVIEGRHDPTIPPRMVPVAEAMLALVLADHMIRAGRIPADSLLK